MVHLCNKSDPYSCSTADNLSGIVIDQEGLHLINSLQRNKNRTYKLLVIIMNVFNINYNETVSICKTEILQCHMYRL